MELIRTTAEGYARALAFGLVATDQVIAWVDKQIDQLDDPPYALIEASLATDDNLLINALRSVPGDCDAKESCRQLYRHMHRALANNADLVGPIIGTFFSMAVAREVPTEAEYDIYALEHKWDHVKDGTFIDTGAVRRELVDFLVRYKDKP